MIKGTTESGFSFEIPDERFNNMEVIDLLREIQRGEEGEIGEAEMLFAVSGLAELLLGKKDKKRMYNHLRKESGQVPIDAVMAEVMNIFNASKQGN